MIIDKKVESGFPLPVKVMSIIPMGVGGLMIYSLLWQFVLLGAGIIIICLGVLASHSRVTVDFKNKKVRSYIYSFGLKFGKWKPLFPFEKVTLINKSEQFREVNWDPYQNRITNKTLLTFNSNSVSLNIRNKTMRLTIAISKYKKMKKLGLEIAEYTGKDLLDFTSGKAELIK